MATKDSETRQALVRLKRRVGKERARYVRIGNEKFARTGFHDERIHGEINVCDTFTRFIDAEIEKTR